MRGKNMLLIPLIAVLLVNIPIVGISVGQSPVANVSINPATNTAPVTGSFVVDVDVADVVDLYGWEAKISFVKSVLDVTKALRGPFLNNAYVYGYINKTTYVRTIDNGQGFVILGAALQPNPETGYPFVGYPPNGASGSGTLASITFYVETIGVSDIHFEYVKLFTVIGNTLVEIASTSTDGLFDNRLTNLAPFASFTAPDFGLTEEPITFDSSASYDPDGWLVDHAWDFNTDGIVDAHGEIVEYTFLHEGDFTVTLTVTDNGGPDGVKTASATAMIQIGDLLAFGTKPDLYGKGAWPETHQFYELSEPDRIDTLFGKVGNPADVAYKVKVVFRVHNHYTGELLGVLTTEERTIPAGEVDTLTTDFDTTELRWRTTTGPWDWPYWHKKYYVIARAYYFEGDQWVAGFFIYDFHIKVYPAYHDIAVTNISASSIYIPAGTTVNVDVTATNLGDLYDVISVSLAYDLNPISEVTGVVLNPGYSTTKSFTWDTTGVSPGAHVLVGRATVVTYERVKYIADNTMYLLVYITTP